MKLLLASGSPRRRELMHRCGMEFEQLQIDVEEDYEPDEPGKIVQMLSRRKADAALCKTGGKANDTLCKPIKKADATLCKSSENTDEILCKLNKEGNEDYIIICADTMVAIGDEILGKPKDREDARRMLRLIQGTSHQVYTGVTLAKVENGENSIVTFCEKTDVIVFPMTEEEICEYSESGECDDKAGAYAIQGLFAKYIKGFNGDFDNVVGLPVKRLCEELRKLGFPAPMPIHMVVSDIDGTLVKDSSPSVYPEMIDAIRQLRKKGILFCIATGRQYYSVRHMFEEVADDIIYLCENGAHVVYNGQDLHIKKMEDNIVKELLGELRGYREKYEMVISTPNGSFLENPSESFETLIRDSYHNKYQVTDDFLKENLPCIKAAIYHKGSIREFGEGYMIPRWQSRLKACMAGDEWVDFMDLAVDKGDALCFLQKYFDVSREETMVFGDNANDIGLIQAAEESYAVENAREEVREKAKYICPGYQQKGVYEIIKKRLLD